MNILLSLRSRIFLASALLAMLCIGVAIFVVNARVTQEAERTLEREIVATAALVDNLRTTRAETFVQMARFIADAPPLKASVDTDDPDTVQPKVDEYRNQVKSNLLLVTNRQGRVLATVGVPAETAAIIAAQPAIRAALTGHESSSLLAQPNGILQLATVPVFVVTMGRPDILGTVSIGFLLDDELAGQMKSIMGSDVAFGMEGRVLAATLPRHDYAALAPLLGATTISRVNLGGDEYEALPRSLAGASTPNGPVVLILRSRTEQLRSLNTIHSVLIVTAIVAVLLATALSFAVARSIVQPLAAITGVMREVATTGDLTRKIAPAHGNRWDDEDARLLANTFNMLTDSIARFQREISNRERLASLGRLSTVIAHEVRNPLMIIKASLHTLRARDVDASTLREAVRDIDEEVARLNRIVNEVLDFARPIRFDVAPVDLNALCRDAAAAAEASGNGASIALDLDPAIGAIRTDGERLRIALVNILLNARHAVDGAAGSVTFTTRSGPDRVTLAIADQGRGIEPEALAHVFDPYFTTKRGGTGLGLPIAKNIIEGLGGTIAVSSSPGRGTELTIELPIDPAHGRPVEPSRDKPARPQAVA